MQESGKAACAFPARLDSPGRCRRLPGADPLSYAETLRMTDYLRMDEVLAMHADQIERYGGTPGVRDRGLLEAAVYRPQAGYYADLIEEAAALWESMAQNHPFFDGNKRTAFAAAYTFLAVNGAPLTAGARQTYDFIAGLYAANQFRFDRLAPWMREHAAR